MMTAAGNPPRAGKTQLYQGIKYQSYISRATSTNWFLAVARYYYYGWGISSSECVAGDNYVTRSHYWEVYDEYTWDGRFSFSFAGITDAVNRRLHQVGYGREYLIRGTKQTVAPLTIIRSAPECGKPSVPCKNRKVRCKVPTGDPRNALRDACCCAGPPWDSRTIYYPDKPCQ